jgi:hypothetical protein
MEIREVLCQRVRREQQLNARLRLVTTRLVEAEQEHIWAIVAAHHAGLSIRQIAAATGLSRSRIHQLLHNDDAREIPAWHMHLRAHDLSSAGEADADQPVSPSLMPARVADEVEVLRWCINWLKQLERGEMVVVNLRADMEDATEFVRFDHARVRRVLARMAADVDELARHTPDAETGRPMDCCINRGEYGRAV